MLAPKRVKFRKKHKGLQSGVSGVERRGKVEPFQVCRWPSFGEGGAVDEELRCGGCGIGVRHVDR